MVMSKAGSEVILKCLMGRRNEIDVESLPWGPVDERVPAGIETVIEAPVIRPARGAKIEEIMVKRENGGSQRVVIGLVGDDDEIVKIKQEHDT